MASKKNKQQHSARMAFCPTCNETKEVEKVMVVSKRTTWRDRCRTCSNYVDALQRA